MKKDRSDRRARVPGHRRQQGVRHRPADHAGDHRAGRALVGAAHHERQRRRRSAARSPSSTRPARVTGRAAQGARPGDDPARGAENARRALAQAAPEQPGRGAERSGAAAVGARSRRSASSSGRPDADVEREKNWLIAPPESAGRTPPGADRRASRRRRARPTDSPSTARYDLYVSTSLDDATEGVIYEALRQALVNATARGQQPRSGGGRGDDARRRGRAR